MSHRMTAVLSGALATVALIMIISGLMLAYLHYVTYDPPYKVMNPQAHYATMLDDETIAVVREFEVTKPSEFTITREVSRRLDGTLIRVEMPTTVVDYEPGKYRVQRIHEVPRLEPGKYDLANRICWSANPLRRDCIDLPILTVDIPTESK